MKRIPNVERCDGHCATQFRFKQAEGEDIGAGGDGDILLAAQQVGDRLSPDRLARIEVPNRFARFGVEGYKLTVDLAGEQQSAGGGRARTPNATRRWSNRERARTPSTNRHGFRRLRWRGIGSRRDGRFRSTWWPRRSPPAPRHRRVRCRGCRRATASWRRRWRPGRRPSRSGWARCPGLSAAGQTTVPFRLGSMPGTLSGRPSGESPVAQFSFSTKGEPCKNFPVTRSSR